ncbi:3'-5' exonuclease [Azospirillum sp. B21]|uniref:3'-5' exonuclease n=1 Tax=Azospirillum sp. B21 TaxID=2607496 RepID=UPI0011ED88CD|nr:3'-5' exonuclease [Azospirillum sp. B21]KAA0579052.1 3'-5' exonuclease [Azospirillum sp. B21]
MKTLLFYDTETTGLPDFKAPSDADHQPHITQLAALLTDEAGNKLASLDLLVRPDGWTIPPDLQQLTGITMERAEAGGVPELVALSAFEALWRRANLRIAHNESFDARILRIGFKRFAGICDPDEWKNGPAKCTQVLSTPILKLPPTEKMKAAGRNHHKSANLREAYEFFTGKPLSGAHNAMIDVMGVKAVWFAIQERSAPSAQMSASVDLAEAV